MSHTEKFPGLQAHSVGEHYPFAVVGKGTSFQAQNLVTGELVSPRYRYNCDIPHSCERAHRHAERACERGKASAASNVPAKPAKPAKPVNSALTEFTILLPTTRQDGEPHDYTHERWLVDTLVREFGGYTTDGSTNGVWLDPHGRKIRDISRKIIVAVKADKIDFLLAVLASEICRRFGQKCLYVSQTGKARLIGPQAE